MKYLFVRIPKTASTSICQILKPFEHKTALEWKEEIGSQWDNYYVFSVVRNPYDRFISMYYFFSVFGKAYKEDGVIKKQDINEWLAEHNLNDLFRHSDYKFVRPQTDYLYSMGSWEKREEFLFSDENIPEEPNELLVKHIIKFESLNEEWPKLLADLDIEFVDLPHKRRWFLRPENVRLTSESTFKIYEFYKEDFDLLGYESSNEYAAPPKPSVGGRVIKPLPPPHSYKDDFKKLECKNKHFFTKETTQYFFNPEGKAGRRCLICKEEELL